ncbi:MAG: type II toxin-antitoxin system HicB family antitoxin [Candidatus Coatesbacteria bacterium]|nr:type II toxin-antitoxin system HicB family antitoxin [Candidatus Coatesbacteria bacterium]
MIADRPYAFTLRAVGDGYEITFPELPGCVTHIDALDDLEKHVKSTIINWMGWLEDEGYEVPEPRDNVKYSGRILLRCPTSLHRALVEMAGLEGTSLNQLLVQSASQSLGLIQGKRIIVDAIRELKSSALDVIASLYRTSIQEEIYNTTQEAQAEYLIEPPCAQMIGQQE